MIIYRITDKFVSDQEAPISLIPLTINNASPGTIVVGLKDSPHGYNPDKYNEYKIKSIQIQPIETYTLKAESSMDGTNFYKVIDDIARTGLETTYLTVTFNERLTFNYAFRLTLTTTSVPDVALNVFMPLIQQGSNYI